MQIKQCKSWQSVYIRYSLAFAKKKASCHLSNYVTLCSTYVTLNKHLKSSTSTLLFLSTMFFTAPCGSPWGVAAFQSPLARCWTDRQPSAVLPWASHDYKTCNCFNSVPEEKAGAGVVLCPSWPALAGLSITLLHPLSRSTRGFPEYRFRVIIRKTRAPGDHVGCHELRFTWRPQDAKDGSCLSQAHSSLPATFGSGDGNRQGFYPGLQLCRC